MLYQVRVIPFVEAVSVTPAAAGRRKKAPHSLFQPCGANGNPTILPGIAEYLLSACLMLA
jgi:hypothetical protein